MPKSIKLKNNTYWDSKGITHNNKLLSDILYPVGSIYMSVNSTDPSILFGGTWKQIKGRFLLGTGTPTANTDNYFGYMSGTQYNAGVGSTGGQDYHTLTKSELPNYDLSALKWSNGWAVTLDGGTSGNGYKLAYEYANYSPGQVDGFRMNTGGGGQKHNNMPPYYTVYIWERTA